MHALTTDIMSPLIYVNTGTLGEDGFNWHMSPLPPYGTQVKLTSGETVTVATRERPKMWFDR
jgi:hypothetical protein